MLNDLSAYINDHLFDIISLVLTLGGGLFALIEIRSSVKNNRANYINDILHRIMDDEGIRMFLNYADYGKDWYTNEFHHGTEEDRIVARNADKTLFNYNYVCYLIDEKIINKKETELIAYYMYVLAHDDELGRYFLDLYQYSVLNNEQFPFMYYLNFCIKEGLIPAAVRDKRYFFEIMKLESDINRKKKPTCPPEIMEIRDRYGKKLFIHFVSRCEFCRYYDKDNDDNKNHNKCKEGKKTEDHYWMTSDSPCSLFCFDENKWKSEMQH